MISHQSYKSCTLCPRHCKVDRLAGETGVCGETAELRIASIGAHHGEEPSISGNRGSGTIFFSGCSLRCVFCQNYDISFYHSGELTTSDAVVEQINQLIERQRVHNINFVTPDHFIPHVLEISNRVRQTSRVSMLFNASGYSEVETLKALSGNVDMYMPDFKYADAELAEIYSQAKEYPKIVVVALEEMIKQVGFLDARLEERHPATRGVMVRHLILPGYPENSIRVMDTLRSRFGRDIPISLLSQYSPPHQLDIKSMNRRLSNREYTTVVQHTQSLGFNNLYIQSSPTW